MYLIIGADFVPTKSNYELFESGDIDTLFGEKLKRYLLDAEYRIFNLEVPLVDSLDPIPKCGPNLVAPTSTIAAYKAIGVNLFTLANNHALDQNYQGMKSTCKVLDTNHINHLGLGEKLNEAAKPFFFDFSNKRIGVYTCCEHEFGIATDSCAGVNPFDPFESLDHINHLKTQCDYVIVLYHGGKEHYRYPSPMLQKTCRKMIEKGADLVVCQHSHCIGCEEKYQGGTIVYGQGNFLFDYCSNECWNTGMLISLNEKFEVSYTPIRKRDNVVRLAESDDARQILEGFYFRSKEIQRVGFIDMRYKAFADSVFKNYLWALSGIKPSLLYKIVDKIIGRHLTEWQMKKKYTFERKLVLLNYIECEAHRELCITGLKNSREDRG